jgi:hypothetical protein
MVDLRYLFTIAIIIFPSYGIASGQDNNLNINLTHHWAGYFSLLVMVVAYIAAMFEEVTELKKSKPMLLAAGLIWLAIVFVYQQQGNTEPAVQAFKSNLLTYIELVLFIMVSMTYLNASPYTQVIETININDLLAR